MFKKIILSGIILAGSIFIGINLINGCPNIDLLTASPNPVVFGEEVQYFWTLTVEPDDWPWTGNIKWTLNGEPISEIPNVYMIPGTYRVTAQLEGYNPDKPEKKAWGKVGKVDVHVLPKVSIDSIKPQYLAKGSKSKAIVTFTILPRKDYVPKSATMTAGGKTWTLVGLTGGGTWTVNLIEGTDLPDVGNYSVTITVDGATSNVGSVTVFGVDIQPNPSCLVKNDTNNFVASIIPSGSPIYVKKWKWSSGGSPASSTTNTYNVTFSKEGKVTIAITASTDYGNVSDEIESTVFSLSISTPDGRLANINGESITLKAETNPLLTGGTYQWSIVSGPGNGTFSDSSSRTTEFTGTALGQVTVNATINISGASTSAQETLTVIPKPTFRVEIIRPDANPYLSATSPVETPLINFQAKVIDSNGKDITSQARISWKVQVEWEIPGRAVYRTPKEPKTLSGSSTKDKFDTGGTLHIKVTAVREKDSALNNKDINILGTQPQVASVKTELGTPIFKAIAHWESNGTFAQFESNGYPVREGNDFGIMRINQPSHPQSFPGVAWNWYENVRYGKNYYEKKCLKNATNFNRDNKNAKYGYCQK